MKSKLILTFLVILVIQAYGQHNLIGIPKPHGAPIEWKIADSLNKAGYNLRNSEPTNSHHALLKALEISRRSHYIKGEAVALKNIGFYHRYRWELQPAIASTTAALRLFTNIRDTIEQVTCLYNLSIALSYMGEKYAALDTSLKSIRLAAKLNDTNAAYKWTVLHMLQIGNIYSSVQEPDTAKRYLHMAWNIAKIHRLPDTFRCYQGLGEVAEQERQWSTALYYYRKGLSFALGHDPPHTILIIANLLDIANVYYGSGDYKHAVALADSVKDIIATKPDFAGYQSWADYVLTKAETRNGNYATAKENALNCLHASVNMGPMAYSDEVKFWLSNIHAAQHNYDSAYYYLSAYKTFQDSVSNVKVFKKWWTATLKDQNNLLDEKVKFQDETITLQKQLDKQKNKGLVAICICLFILAVFSTSLFRSRRKINALLHNILPKQIVREFRLRSEVRPKDIDEVSVLFTDFVDFTQISEQMNPEELIQTLNIYFKAFDDITAANNLEKIKTIGDAYMAAGGLPEPNETNATDAVRAAIGIRDFVKGQNEKNSKEGKPFFDIRIGIHSGPVVAGVIGKRKYAYDIWGATVNTANRMESCSEPGKVNISGTTYERVKDSFECTFRGKLPAKHIGDVDMYFVL